MIECLHSGTCLVKQFFDGGATSIDTTYRITRWDNDRIEAESGSVNIPDSSLSEEYRQELATTCLILNRTKKQAFTAQRQNGQTCRQLDKYIDNGVEIGAEQLCTLLYDAPNCPNPRHRTDKPK